MSWADEQWLARTRAWPGLESLLTALPGRLFRQARLLQYDLAIRYADSGQFRDIFLGPGQLPVLSVATWLFDDLGSPTGAEREQAETQLTRASVLLACQAYMVERLHDPDAFYQTDHVALIQYASEMATLELARTVSPETPFWDAWASATTDHLERWLERRERETRLDPTEDPEADLDSPWSGVLGLTARAACSVAGREAVGPSVAGILADLAIAFRIRDDLGSLGRDLERGLPTYPIAVIARTAELRLRPWPRPTVVLGAMIATGSLDGIHEAALSRLRQAGRDANELGLPTFVAYLDDATGRLAERFASPGGGLGLSGGVPSTRPGAAPRTSGGPSAAPPRLVPTIDQSLAMAEGFLLADPSFRESWESHREGMFGAELVASRFPAALVLEILARHGHDVTPEIDEFLAFTAGNGFRYFDHPSSGIDTDTLGAYLRLLPQASRRDAALAAGSGVLDCLERNVRDRRSVPVWISGCVDPSVARPPVLDLGEHCGTVAAHLLLGLAVVGSGRDAEVLEIGLSELLDRIRDLGLGANVDYPPLYAIGVYLALLARVDERPVGASLQPRATVARTALHAELDRVRHGRIGTAQDAAFVIAACLEADQLDRVDRGWISLILRQQRFDGSWIGEPVFAAPNRGRSVTWYSSTTLTTAWCYDALMRVSRGGRRGTLEGPQ